MKNILTFFLFLSLSLSAKVRILTFHCNCPFFIEMQHDLFEKFLSDDFEIIVFNDARTDDEAQEIASMCKRYDITHVRYEQTWHIDNPLNDYIHAALQRPDVKSHISFADTTKEAVRNQVSVRHCHAIQYALDNYGYNHNDIVVVCDGDAFPIRPMSIAGMLHGYDIIGAARDIWTENLSYLWVVFCVFHPRKLPDCRDLRFHLDVINSQLHDSGSHTYHYLAAHPQLRVLKSFNHPSSLVAKRDPSWLRRQGLYGDAMDRMRSIDPREYAKWLQEKGFAEAEIDLIHMLPPSACVEFFFDQHLLHFGGGSFVGSGHSEKLKSVQAFVHEILQAPTFGGIWGLQNL